MESPTEARDPEPGLDHFCLSYDRKKLCYQGTFCIITAALISGAMDLSSHGEEACLQVGGAMSAPRSMSDEPVPAGTTMKPRIAT